MKKILCILLLMSIGIHFLNAQSSVAIGDSNPKASAVLYLKGNGSQGLIIPIVSNTGSIATPESGMVVYNSGDNLVYFYKGSTASWVSLGSGSSTGSTYTLSISGNNLLLKDATSTVSTVPIAATAPTAANQFLTWDGSKWVATAFSQDATNANGVITVKGIQGKALPALPSTTRALVYNATTSAWEFQPLTGAGTVTNVATGTGLVGGPVTTTGTISVDVGTTANKIVQLDASGKLPAVDGSLLTNLAGGGDITGVTAGTGLTGGAASGNATLNVDVGTTANKIVQLDASGKLPAVDGSQLTNLTGGSGTVTSVSVTSAGGVSGTVTNPTTTPAITLSLGAITPTSVTATGAISGSNLSGTNTGDQTTITGNAGTATSLQTGRTISITGDVTYASPLFNGTSNVSGAATVTKINGNTIPANASGALTNDGSGNLTWIPSGGSGTVTSVGLSMPAIFTVSGSPITTTGTLSTSLSSQSASTVFAAPSGSAGVPTFRAIVPTDIPTLNQNTSGTAATITGNITESQVTNLTTDLGNKVTANSAITAGTNTKITYDAKGLVTAGAPLAVSDIPVMTATVGGAVPTPPNNTTTFLRGDGTFAAPAGGGTVTAVSVATANGFSGSSSGGTTPALTIVAGAITPTSVAATGTVTGSNLSGTNTGDNAVNTLYSGLVSNATHTGDATGATALTVKGINGVLLSGLGTGILKNTTGTGVPSIATGADLPVMTATVGGAVPTPPNNTTTFLRGDGTFAAPAAGMTNPLTTTGDIIYGVGTTPTRLAGATGVLKSTGAAAPSWGAIVDADVSGTAAIAGSKINPNFVAQNISTTGTTTASGGVVAGASSQFIINGTGNITKINNVITSFPAAQGAANTVLVNDGAGALTWTTAPSPFSTTNIVPRGNGTTLVASTIQDDGTTTGIGVAPSAANKLTVTNTTAGILQSILATNGQVGAGSSIAVKGDASGSTNTNFGIYGTATGGSVGATGVYGVALTSPISTGVFGLAQGAGATTAYGVRGSSSSTTAVTNYGVYGDASGGTTNWAGYFKGNLAFEGALAVGATPSAGTSGQVLASAGPGLPPIWTTPSGTTLINNTGTNNLYAGDLVSTSGTDNSIFGYHAGQTNTGLYNTIVGSFAGNIKTTGDLNTLVGWYAGKSTTSTANTYIGAQAGEKTTGNVNTFVGEKAGQNTTTGAQNVIVGSQAGLTNTTGGQLVLIGQTANVGAAGLSNAVAIGYGAVVNASNSMILGNTSMKVGIGNSAPRSALEIQGGDLIMSGNSVKPIDPADINFKTLSDVFIAKIWTDPALNALYFSTNTSPNNNQDLAIDPSGNVGINTITPTSTLSVNGTADKVGGGTWGTFSDRRVKKDVRSFSDGLDVLMKFKPVQFKYNGLAGYNEDGKDYVGVIAQDVLPIAPYMISTVRKKLNESDQTETDILKYDGSALTYVLVNSIKEQQTQIEDLKKVIQGLETKLKAYENNETTELAVIRAEIKKLSDAMGMEASAEKKK